MDQPENSQTPAADEPDPALDRLTKLVANVFDAPIAVIALLTDDRLQLKSTNGLDDAEPIEIMEICARAPHDKGPLVLKDIGDFERLHRAPNDATASCLQFFASTPIIASTGQVRGVISIADRATRATFSARNIANLQSLADLAADTLEQQEAEEFRQLGAAYLSAMSHDVRTPLNGILGMAELLLATDELDDRHRRRIQIIKQSGRSLLTMLDPLFALARADARQPKLDPSTVDLRTLVQDIINQAQTNRRAGAPTFDLNNHLEEQCSVVVDTRQIRDVLLSFLESVSKLAAGETIRLDVASEPAGRQGVQVRFDADGLSADAADQSLANLLKDPGSSPDKFSEARLGLILCKKLARTMGADIGFDQNSEEGTTAWLTFSFASASGRSTTSNASEEVAIPTRDIEGDASSGAIRDVLVAEDDPEMACLIEELLEEAGYHATVAPDGASALSIIDDQRIDVVLMDGRLPDMSGFEAAKHIRQLPDKRANLPIIALTGEALPGDRERYLSAGMDEYLLKPVDYETLIGTIDRCIDGKRC